MSFDCVLKSIVLISNRYFDVHKKHDKHAVNTMNTDYGSPDKLWMSSGSRCKFQVRELGSNLFDMILHTDIIDIAMVVSVVSL